jgi:hypothetical protein
LAQYSVATDLNPFVGECYFLPSIGPGPGIAGWRKKAEEMLQFEAEKAKIPVAKFWCEYVQNGEGEAHYNPEKGDIAVKAILHDEISRTKWEKRILSHFIELIKSQVEKDEAWKLANELGGPEPTWSAVAVVHGSENFGATEKYDRYERCCKRAEKLAIRKRFPLIDLPEPVGFDENYIDAEVKDVPEQLPPEQPQIEQPQPAGNGKARPYMPEVTKSHLLEAAQKITKTASDKQRSLLVMLFEKCLAGEGAELKRHAVQNYLYGAASIKDVPDNLVLASLNTWMKPTQDSGGDYKPDEMAAREVVLVYDAALREQGQMDMPLNEEAKP